MANSWLSRMACIWSRLVWTCTLVLLARRASVVMDWRGRMLSLRLTVRRLHATTIRRSWSTLGLATASAVVIWVTPLSTDRVRNVGNHLHATRSGAGRTTSASSVCRGCWAAEALCELLNESASYVICGDVDRVSNAQNNEGPLG